MIRELDVKQISIEALKTPFECGLDKNNRREVVSRLVPWEMFVEIYGRALGVCGSFRRFTTGSGRGSTIKVTRSQTASSACLSRTFGPWFAARRAARSSSATKFPLVASTAGRFEIGCRGMPIMRPKTCRIRENVTKNASDIILELTADNIYDTRANREWLAECKRRRKELNSRSRIEGKFGEGKRAYALNEVKAKRTDTGESWIAAVLFVTNLARLLREFFVSVFLQLNIAFFRLFFAVKEQNRVSYGLAC